MLGRARMIVNRVSQKSVSEFGANCGVSQNKFMRCANTPAL